MEVGRRLEQVGSSPRTYPSLSTWARMIRLDLDTSGLTAAQGFFARFTDQLPFASSLALNQTARQVQLAFRDQTAISFSSPTPFTRSAFRYTKSTKANLVAEVFPSSDRAYIATQSFGGQRRWKDYEGFIRGLAAASGSALPDRQLVPTALAVNAAGNPKRNLFGQIESRLSTTDPGGFFIGTPRGGNRGPGVYRRSRGRLFPYFLTVERQPTYSPRFPFERVGRQTVARVFNTNLSAAIDRAIATAR